jgi:hypothetical protein
MTMRELREVLSRRADGFDASDCSPRRLLLEEVLEAGLPAYFFDHGEQLVYLDGELYDLSAASKASGPLQALPHSVLESGVGIEYGWHHARPCACPLCHPSRRVGADEDIA